MQQYDLKIFGKVQGVGFRWYVERISKKLGLKGYVRNEIDGTVKIVVEGDIEKIKELLKYLKIGNGYSMVTDIKILNQKEIEKFTYQNFTIKF